MDLDFDLEYDRIGQFLKSKLQEIQNKNHELEESLRYRQEITKTKCSKLTHSFQIGEVWKRIFQENYVVGYAIENTIDHYQIVENLGMFVFSNGEPLKKSIEKGVNVVYRSHKYFF